MLSSITLTMMTMMMMMGRVHNPLIVFDERAAHINKIKNRLYAVREEEPSVEKKAIIIGKYLEAIMMMIPLQIV